MEISTEIVKRLIEEQFPKWKELEIKGVEKSGHDNRTFHLGDKMTVRLPSGEAYVPQVKKELRWLPILQKEIGIKITTPIKEGSPSELYPFPWSVNNYIEGENASYENIQDLKAFARDLSKFLKELQKISTLDGPIAGTHNFYRGGNLEIYNKETEEALKNLKDTLPVGKLKMIWSKALKSSWQQECVWIHGDIAPGNLLVREGKLCGVIDFGIMGVGDPSCDYAMAWTFFEEDNRVEFLKEIDNETIERAKGWALWKVLITYNNNKEEVRDNARKTIKEILKDYK
ncbi:aminoglycoside phosphotransferase family protein [uncultured Clostridium sp.]|uniref:aminoglycoside phosphotransferase family protein n=1 Tax=uncultured Clostridium sp. TaxID=59620 RepID=UPI0026237306|nr:aminoglycoside phosphotransferase family protein [uncultured Clostridium sp.]